MLGFFLHFLSNSPLQVPLKWELHIICLKDSAPYKGWCWKHSFKTQGQNIVVAETKLGLKTRLAFQINQLNYWPPRRPCQATGLLREVTGTRASPLPAQQPHWYTPRFREAAFFPYHLLPFSPLFSQDKALINSFPFYLYPLVIAKVSPLDLQFNIMSMSWGNIIHAISWNLTEKVSILFVTVARVVVSWWGGGGGCRLYLQAPANV